MAGFGSLQYNNYSFYGMLSNYIPAGYELYCEDNNFHQTALNGMPYTVNQGFFPFGRFIASAADVQTSISKRTSAGYQVPLAILPTSTTTVDQIKGVSLFRRLGMYESNANWRTKDIYDTTPNGDFTGYQPRELITYTDRSRAIMLNISSGTGVSVGSAITIDTTANSAQAGSIAATGLALPITVAKAIAPAIIFASDARLGQLDIPGCVGVQLIELKLF